MRTEQQLGARRQFVGVLNGTAACLLVLVSIKRSLEPDRYKYLPAEYTPPQNVKGTSNGGFYRLQCPPEGIGRGECLNDPPT